MLRTVRAELVRLTRPGMLLAWYGLTALFAAMVNTIMFSVAAEGADLPAGAPGVAFPTLTELASPSGLTAGLGAASSMFGVVTLAFWAIAVATDYNTGLIRLLAAIVPRRWPLLGGKVAALAALTAVATTVAMMVTVAVAPQGARSAGIDTTAWTESPASTIARAWAGTFAALLVWGLVGLAVAYLTRSAAVAISVGVGYVLVVEPMLSRVFDQPPGWLLGTTLTALAKGGTAAVSLSAATAAALAYTALALAASGLVLVRRDITD